MNDALNTIRRVAGTTSKNEKVALLQEGDSQCLRNLCLWTYDRFRTYRLQNILPPPVYAEVTDSGMWNDLGKLLDRLASHTVGTNKAKTQVSDLLCRCSEDDARIIANIINRDLRAGIDTTLINTAFPGLIPTFALQSGKALDAWERVVCPIIVDEKIDGIRCVGVYDGTVTTFFSRNGFQFESGMEAFAEEIERLLPGIPLVYDAEFRAFKFNPEDKVCQKHKDGNWQFEYAKAISRRKEIDPEEIRQHFKLYIWDVIDHEFFTTQGKRGPDLPVEERKRRLFTLFERHGIQFQNIEMLPSYLMRSHAEIRAYMRELKLARKEGCMLKPLGASYSFSKNWNVIKLKHFVEGDFRIKGAFEGTGKYEGMLGGLIIGTDDGLLTSRMGTGITDSDRVELWVEFLSGRLTGRIVEIQLKDITADGSLQLPSLLRFREDKDTTDTLQDLQEKLAGLREDEEG